MVQIPNSFSAGGIVKSAEVNENFDTVANAILPTFVFTIIGTLVTGTSLTPALIVNNNLTIDKAYAYVKTAPTGQAILVDILKNGVSIWNTTPANRLTITAGTQSGTQVSFDTTSLSESDILTIDVDQIGSTVAGQDITVELKTV